MFIHSLKERKIERKIITMSKDGIRLRLFRNKCRRFTMNVRLSQGTKLFIAQPINGRTDEEIIGI